MKWYPVNMDKRSYVQREPGGVVGCDPPADPRRRAGDPRARPGRRAAGRRGGPGGRGLALDGVRALRVAGRPLRRARRGSSATRPASTSSSPPRGCPTPSTTCARRSGPRSGCTPSDAGSGRALFTLAAIDPDARRRGHGDRGRPAAGDGPARAGALASRATCATTSTSRRRPTSSRSSRASSRSTSCSPAASLPAATVADRLDRDGRPVGLPARGLSRDRSGRRRPVTARRRRGRSARRWA